MCVDSLLMRLQGLLHKLKLGKKSSFAAMGFCPLIFHPYVEDTSISHPNFQFINYTVPFITSKCNQL